MKYGNSILTYLLEADERWFVERELDKRIGSEIQLLEANEIAKACYAFYKTYLSTESNRAGYYLLWLIKASGDCTFEIPKRAAFSASTVKEVLSQFFAGEAKFAKTKNLIEILMYCPYRGGTPPKHHFAARG